MSFNSYFDELERVHGIRLTADQKRWYVKKAEVLGDDMKKEFPSTPDEAFETNVDGLYYAAHVSAARTSGRVLNIPHDPTLPVHTAWDLGFRDANSIIMFQIAGKEIHIIDFLEGSRLSMAEYIKLVKQKDYLYGVHLAPHDIKIHEYSTGTTRYETATKLGINFVLVPDISLADGIDSVRNLFPRLYFNSVPSVLNLLKHLENYSQKWDTQLGLWSGRPEHDVHSHAADALRYLAVGLNYCINESSTMTQEQADAFWRTYGRKI